MSLGHSHHTCPPQFVAIPLPTFGLLETGFHIDLLKHALVAVYMAMLLASFFMLRNTGMGEEQTTLISRGIQDGQIAAFWGIVTSFLGHMHHSCPFQAAAIHSTLSGQTIQPSAGCSHLHFCPLLLSKLCAQCCHAERQFWTTLEVSHASKMHACSPAIEIRQWPGWPEKARAVAPWRSLSSCKPAP